MVLAGGMICNGKETGCIVYPPSLIDADESSPAVHRAHCLLDEKVVSLEGRHAWVE